MQTPEAPNETSKYNDAVLSINRLHNIWLSCRYYKNNGKYDKWKRQLEDAWSELITDVKRNENRLVLERKNLKHMETVANTTTRTQSHFALYRWQLFLREVQDLAGKAGSYIDEDEESLE